MLWATRIEAGSLQAKVPESPVEGFLREPWFISFDSDDAGICHLSVLEILSPMSDDPLFYCSFESSSLNFDISYELLCGFYATIPFEISISALKLLNISVERCRSGITQPKIP